MGNTNFPTSLDSYVDKTDNVDDVMAVDFNNPAAAIVALETKVGINSSIVTTTLDYKVNNFFVAGRKLWLYEDTAPTGWSIVAITDRVLAVKGGTDAYNVSGGNGAGTWTQPNHTHTGPSHTHTGPSHTHAYTTTHNHQVTVVGATSTDMEVFNAAGAQGDINNLHSKEGSFEAIPVQEAVGTHNADLYTNKVAPGTSDADGTGATGADGAGATGNGATAATYRPTAAVGIVVTKS